AAEAAETDEAAAPDLFPEIIERLIGEHQGQRLPLSAAEISAAFGRAADACAWAIAIPRAHADEGARVTSARAEVDRSAAASATAPGQLPRVVLHTCEVEIEAPRAWEEALAHARRVSKAAHPGQIVCTEVAAGLLRRSATHTTSGIARLVDLGA